METFKSFAQNSYQNYISKFYSFIKDTHNKKKIGAVDVFYPKQKSKQPNRLITSGIQGDEPAGPISLLEWVEVNKVPSNIFIIPIVSAESYLNKTHFDDSGKNVNLNIPNNPADEIKELINSALLQSISAGGYLSCQEDPKRDAGYLLVWKDNKELVQNFLETIKSNFKLHGDGVLDFTINDNETLGNYCAKLGAPFSITTETPVINTSINKRVDAQVSMIAKFVEYNGTV